MGRGQAPTKASFQKESGGLRVHACVHSHLPPSHSVSSPSSQSQALRFPPRPPTGPSPAGHHRAGFFGIRLSLSYTARQAAAFFPLSYLHARCDPAAWSGRFRNAQWLVFGGRGLREGNREKEASILLDLLSSELPTEQLSGFMR